MGRPITTLFMLMSVDGKISTGATDELDVVRDFPNIPGVMEGLHQYFVRKNKHGNYYYALRVSLPEEQPC